MSGWRWFVTTGTEPLPVPDDDPGDPFGTPEDNALQQELEVERATEELGYLPKRRYWNVDERRWTYKRHHATIFPTRESAEKAAFGMTTKNPKAVQMIGAEKLWYETPEIKFHERGPFRAAIGRPIRPPTRLKGKRPIHVPKSPPPPFVGPAGQGIKDAIAAHVEAELAEPDSAFPDVELPTMGEPDEVDPEEVFEQALEDNGLILPKKGKKGKKFKEPYQMPDDEDSIQV